jgi:hypothetical protein
VLTIRLTPQLDGGHCTVARADHHVCQADIWDVSLGLNRYKIDSIKIGHIQNMPL